jgi:hypothetical protein
LIAGRKIDEMRKFIHNIALLASLIALAAALWQDWGIWLTVKRMLISYMGFFFFGSFLSLAIRAVPLLEGQSQSPADRMTSNRPSDNGKKTRGLVPNDGMESATAGTSHITRKVGQ